MRGSNRPGGSDPLGPREPTPDPADSRIAYAGKHLRLWRRFAIQAAVRETHYRASMMAHISVGLLQLLLALIPVFVLYSYTDSIRGWEQAEVLALVGLFQAMLGVLEAVVGPNMAKMAEYITQGDLDGILLRPMSSQFHMMFRWLNLPALANVVTGLALMTAGLVFAGARPGALEILQAVLLAICGLVLLTCVWSALVYLAFWTQTVNAALMLFFNLLQAGRYPVSFFPSPARLFVTFAIPLAFVTSFPIQALSGAAGGVSWWWVAAGFGLATVAVTLLRLFWRFAISRYASASS